MKRLDLDTLIKGDGHIYIKNCTKPKGTLCINFVEGNDKQSFLLQRTWIPVCITESIPREMLRTSRDFRRYVTNGMVMLLDPDEAKKILETDDAQEEFKRINQSAFTSDAPMTAATKQLLEAHDAKTEISKTQAAQLKIEDEADEQTKVSPAVLDICNRFNAKDLDHKLALNELRILEEELTADDCSYIIANTDGIVRNFAKSKLEELLG